MATKFAYSVASDTLNGAVSAAKLDSEIRAETLIPIELVGVSVTGDSLTIDFQTDLDAGQEAALVSLVAAHDGVPPAKLTPPVASDGTPIVKLDAPSERDKKPVVVVSPATEGWLTWITGAADKNPPDPGTTGRGLGNSIQLDFSSGDASNTTKTVDLQFLEPVEVHDGQLSWSPTTSFNFNDKFSLSAYMAATTVTPNAGGTGNCTKIEISPGSGMNVIVPAAGNGDYDIDLADAYPVPDETHSAYWDVDLDTGDVAFSATPGSDSWNLFDFPVTVMLINKVGMGNPLGVFDVDIYKTEYIHPSWVIKFTVEKATPADCSVGGWLFIFRKYTT